MTTDDVLKIEEQGDEDFVEVDFKGELISGLEELEKSIKGTSL